MCLQALFVVTLPCFLLEIKNYFLQSSVREQIQTTYFYCTLCWCVHCVYSILMCTFCFLSMKCYMFFILYPLFTENVHEYVLISIIIIVTTQFMLLLHHLLYISNACWFILLYVWLTHSLAWLSVTVVLSLFHGQVWRKFLCQYLRSCLFIIHISQSLKCASMKKCRVVKSLFFDTIKFCCL